MSAGAYARAIAAECGAELSAGFTDHGDEPPEVTWARSGALALCGPADGAPLLPDAPLPGCARGVGLALADLLGSRAFGTLDAPALLGERAALGGLSRQGQASAGGSTRLLCAKDGWFVVGLPRGFEDVSLLPAWLGIEARTDEWVAIEAEARSRPRRDIVDRARLLGLPAASVGEADAVPPWLVGSVCGAPAGPRSPVGVRVADLTSLWAGPLTGQLLASAGAKVTKLESPQRRDGARVGSPELFALLNGMKRHEAVAFSSGAAGAELRSALDRADVVLEASRPRALAQLGIDAASWVAAQPGRVWCSITGYGRRAPGAHWVALGDDAAVAGGAVVHPPDGGAPCFVADAVADPLTGLHATLAVAAALARGGGELLDVSLAGVVARGVTETAATDARLVREGAGWTVEHAAGRTAVASPRARRR